jgi:hypothetical protein
MTSRKAPYILLTRVHQWCGVVVYMDGEQTREFIEWTKEAELPAWETRKYVDITPEDTPAVVRRHIRGEVTGSLSFLTSHEGAVLLALRWSDYIEHQDIEDCRARSSRAQNLKQQRN